MNWFEWRPCPLNSVLVARPRALGSRRHRKYCQASWRSVEVLRSTIAARGKGAVCFVVECRRMLVEGCWSFGLAPHHQRALHQPLQACSAVSNDARTDKRRRGIQAWSSFPTIPNLPSSHHPHPPPPTGPVQKLPPAWRPPIAIMLPIAGPSNSGIPGLAAAVQRWAPPLPLRSIRSWPSSTSLQLADSPGRPTPTGALPLWTAISYRKGAMGSSWRHLRPKFPQAEGETACLHRGAGDHGDSTRRRPPLSRLNPPRHS